MVRHLIHLGKSNSAIPIVFVECLPHLLLQLLGRLHELMTEHLNSTHTYVHTYVCFRKFRDYLQLQVIDDLRPKSQFSPLWQLDDMAHKGQKCKLIHHCGGLCQCF